MEDDLTSKTWKTTLIFFQEMKDEVNFFKTGRPQKKCNQKQ